jgi:hypothetical protein
MTFDEFKAQVLVRLSEIGDVAGDEAAMDARISDGCLDLIEYCPELRPNSSVIISPSQTSTATGEYATLFSLGASIDFVALTEVWTIDSEDSEEPASSNRTGPYNRVPWAERFDMLYGRKAQCEHLYCPHPDGRQFYLHPALPADKRIVVHFEDWDPALLPLATVRFPAKAAEAIAHYCRWKYFGPDGVESDASKAAQNLAEYKRLRRLIVTSIRGS